MNLKNRVILIGEVVAEPIYREFMTGKSLTRFSVKTVDTFKRDKEVVKETMWHNVAAWNETSETAKKKLFAGCEVVVDGHLVNRKYTDKTGVIRFVTEVVADTILPQTADTNNYQMVKRA
ncbi:MAG: single-stranded DNA-binding protein [Bacteroidales bacterium]|jgi:single-strand DNA-binding protein|nr:single-stranded DNA-binding protein [Bacteroidales bacterium]MDD4216754.1 single-stranded DNA-binding protein [Bacteroidales bacterium]MDY0141546.1 single-stranded DNA-binding protein [Bacteroidales bacterium]